MSRRNRNKQGDPLSFLISLFIFISILIWQKSNDIMLAIKVFVFSTITLVVFTIGIGLMIKKKKNEKLIKSGIDVVDNMPGLGFERFVLAHFQKLGYKGELTSATNDYGADLILKKDDFKIVVQAKRWKDKVGIKAVQEIVGAINHYGASKGMVITNSYFTSNARALAKSNNIELWDRDKLINIMAENQGKELSEIVTSEFKNTTTYCPLCNSELVERNGKNGSFLGCSSFPKCRFTKNID